MSSLEIFEVQFDFSHVLVYVPAGHDVLFGGDTLLFIIDADQYDRNVCTKCNVVESLFQFGFGERVPSGVMARWNLSLALTCLMTWSTSEVCLSRCTGIPPIQRNRMPSGKKNHSFSS